MLMFNMREATAIDTKSTKGAIYAPVDVKSAEHAVAINDAHIKLKLVIPRFDAKFFGP